MDVSSFLKKLKQQQKSDAAGVPTFGESADRLPERPPVAGDFSSDESSSSSSSDEDEGNQSSVEEDGVGNGPATYSGGERLRRKQAAQYLKKTAPKHSDLEQPALKLMASNTGAADHTGASQRRDADRRMEAMRQRLRAQVGSKRPRTDTLEAIRHQLLQERGKLEQARVWDSPEAAHGVHGSRDKVSGEPGSTVTPSAEEVNLVDISRLLDDAVMPTVATAPMLPDRAPLLTPVTGTPSARSLPEQTVETSAVAPHAREESVTETSDVDGQSVTNPSSAPGDQTTCAGSATVRPSKMSRFARAKQLAQKGGEDASQSTEVLHLQHF